MPWALPGIVLGIGIFSSFFYTPGLRSLYGTIWILLVGLIIFAVPATMRISEGALAQISPELTDAARTSGAGRFRAFMNVVVRLIMPSFVAGWLLAAIIVSGNLSVTILLSTSAMPTVPTQALVLFNTGQTAEAAALFCVFLGLLAIGFVVFGFLLLAARKFALRRVWV
jgi:iron(III) transport system permease protein